MTMIFMNVTESYAIIGRNKITLDETLSVQVQIVAPANQTRSLSREIQWMVRNTRVLAAECYCLIVRLIYSSWYLPSRGTAWYLRSSKIMRQNNLLSGLNEQLT